jgi:hypothetical protein
LGVLLVFSVEGIVLELLTMPGFAALSLACRFGTERLVWDLGAGEKVLATAGADLGFHRASPYKVVWGFLNESSQKIQSGALMIEKVQQRVGM